MFGNRSELDTAGKSVLAAALALLVAPTAQASVWSANGHEYEFVPAENVTWAAASAAARGRGPGWHLSTLTSADEEAFVMSLLPTAVADRSHVWLGGTDAASEGAWRWISGETWAYTNWWPGEPNDNGGAEEYLALDFRLGTWAWNDVSSDIDGRSWARGYVVERATVPLPSTSTLVALASLVVGWRWRRRAPSGPQANAALHSSN